MSPGSPWYMYIRRPLLVGVITHQRVCTCRCGSDRGLCKLKRLHATRPQLYTRTRMRVFDAADALRHHREACTCIAEQLLTRLPCIHAACSCLWAEVSKRMAHGMYNVHVKTSLSNQPSPITGSVLHTETLCIC